MKKMVLAALAGTVLTLAHGAQDWGPMPYPSPNNDATITDFIEAAKQLAATEGEPAYVDKFATYRMCTELALRALTPHRISPVGAMVYTAVRGCTRQMDDYVLLFVRDERFKANYYVAHAIQRLAQQDQIGTLLPLAERLQAQEKLPAKVTRWWRFNP